MKIIKQSHQILELDRNPLQGIEHKHHAMMEFTGMTVKFITDRGAIHELIRHRLCSFAYGSAKYINYKWEIEVILPAWIDPDNCSEADERWFESMRNAESDYIFMIENGYRPEEARSVLPNSLKAEICVKTNAMKWRDIFNLRCSKAAHPQVRALMLPLLEDVHEKVPLLYDALYDKYLGGKDA